MKEPVKKAGFLFLRVIHISIIAVFILFITCPKELFRGVYIIRF